MKKSEEETGYPRIDPDYWREIDARLNAKYYTVEEARELADRVYHAAAAGLKVYVSVEGGHI